MAHICNLFSGIFKLFAHFPITVLYKPDVILSFAIPREVHSLICKLNNYELCFAFKQVMLYLKQTYSKRCYCEHL